MFHTYVLAGSGTSVDPDRARFLMDKALASDCEEWVRQNEDLLSSRGVSSLAQAFWDMYCEHHHRRYGTPFEPDVIPGWDQKAAAAPSR